MVTFAGTVYIYIFFFCIGHRKNQCIDNAHRCNGRLNCIDRSDESNCRTVTQQLDYSIFNECHIEKVIYSDDFNDKVYFNLKKNLLHMAEKAESFGHLH